MFAEVIAAGRWTCVQEARSGPLERRLAGLKVSIAGGIGGKCPDFIRV